MPEIPEFPIGAPLTEAGLHQLFDAIRWRRSTQPHVITSKASVDMSTHAMIQDTLDIDPSTYPDYQGAGSAAGTFYLSFPPVFASLRTVRLLPQSTQNGAMLATVRDESEDGVRVTVYDTGGTTIAPFDLWVQACGPAASGLMLTTITPEFTPPHPGHPITPSWLNRIAKTISFQHGSIPWLFDVNGDQWVGSYGIGEVVGYKFIDPSTYPEYQGAGNHWGLYHVDLPSGLFSSLIGLQVQAASGGNGAIIATVRNPTTTGFDVFVWDSGRTPIYPHALWIRATGLLAQGKLPVTLQDRPFDLISATSSTPLSSELFQGYSDCNHYQLRRSAVLFDLNGNLLSSGTGYGVYEQYVFVEPSRYWNYRGHGGRWGEYEISLPEGLFEQLLYVSVQVAAGTNTWMSASVKNETPGGFTVFVWDAGTYPVQGHAQWVTAIGKLKSGILP